jgi:hypothetical protein
MLLTSLFHATTQPVQITSPKPSLPVQIGQDPPGPTSQQSAPIHTNLDQSAPICTEIAFPARAGLFPSQLHWAQELHPPYLRKTPPARCDQNRCHRFRPESLASAPHPLHPNFICAICAIGGRVPCPRRPCVRATSSAVTVR